MNMDNNFEAVIKALNEKGKFATVTKGISMLPMLRDNKDTVYIKAATFPLAKNDVALYRRKGTKELVLHRVVGKEGDVYLIRGDNTYHKEKVCENDIAGVLEGFSRNGKYHDCKTDKPYHIYVFFMHLLYPARVVLVRIKRLFNRK